MIGRIVVILFVLSVSIYGISALEFTDCGKSKKICFQHSKKKNILKIQQKKKDSTKEYIMYFG